MKFKEVSDDNRKLDINMVAINAYVSRWKPHTPFDIEVVRRVPKKTATAPQRGWYFSCVLPALMSACGYDPDESGLVHRQLKILFFQVQPDEHGIYRDKDIPSVFSLESDIGMEVRGRFIDWVCRKAAENGEYVPNPGE